MNELDSLVLKFFEEDMYKTALWFETPNPLLGGISPAQMIKAGRYDKLLGWVKERLAENEGPEET